MSPISDSADGRMLREGPGDSWSEGGGPPPSRSVVLALNQWSSCGLTRRDRADPALLGVAQRGRGFGPVAVTSL
jgi:hypothetical protein